MQRQTSIWTTSCIPVHRQQNKRQNNSKQRPLTIRHFLKANQPLGSLLQQTLCIKYSSYFKTFANHGKQFVTTTNKGIGELGVELPSDEITWDTLAKRELELEGTLEERIEKLIQTYQSGLKMMPTQKMWNFYLDKVLDLNEDQQTFPNFNKKFLESAFEAAHEAGMLTEKHYILWIKKVENVNTVKVLQFATQRHNNSIELWYLRVKHCLSRNDEKGAFAAWRRVSSNRNLPDPISVWNLMIEYYQIIDPQKGEGLWKKAMCNMTVGARFKAKYVEWLAVSRGIVAARRAYDVICREQPLSLELHFSMAKLEDAQPKLSFKHTRKVYDNAIRQFGQTSTDVWMSYIRFENKFGDATNVSMIHKRAINTLKTDLVDAFNSEYLQVKADSDSRWIPMQVTSQPEPMDVQLVD